jgi:hypothetical protein
MALANIVAYYNTATNTAVKSLIVQSMYYQYYPKCRMMDFVMLTFVLMGSIGPLKMGVTE